MRKLIYTPSINKALREIAKPFSSAIPDKYKFPVTGAITVKTRGGEHFLLRCNPTSYVAKRVFWDGMAGFESSMTDLFIQLARKSSMFLDVGANIGYYSLLAAAINPSIRVVGFEPVPSPCLYFKSSITLNNFEQVTAEQLAVSSEAGEVEFYFSKNAKFIDIEEHHLTSTGSLDKNQAHRTDLLELVRVNSVTLDGYIEEHKLPRIDLVKLDTEATEHLVLAGASKMLSEDKPIIFCEVLPGKVEKEIEGMFKQHGYVLYRLDPNNTVEVDALSHHTSSTNDHLMVHPDRLHEIEPLL